MSSKDKGKPIAPGFCRTHLRCVMACSDGEIERALPDLSAYDLNRLRRILNTPLKGMDEQKEAS